MNYRDPTDPGNSSKHHSGKECVELGCDQPAGTAWSPLWCYAHNVERMDRIGRNLERIAVGLEPVCTQCGQKGHTSVLCAAAQKAMEQLDAIDNDGWK